MRSLKEKRFVHKYQGASFQSRQEGEETEEISQWWEEPHNAQTLACRSSLVSRLHRPLDSSLYKLKSKLSEMRRTTLSPRGRDQGQVN